MTAPSYTEDLTDIATGDEATGWVELTGTDGAGEAYNACGTPAYQDNEYPYIQGLYAVTQDTTKSTAVGSIAYSSGGITVPTDGAVFVWQNYSSPFAFGSYAQGGYRICIGSSLNDFDIWYVGGNDKGRMPYGGWECHVVNPTVTVDDTAGTPTATLDYVGSAVYLVSGPSKGEPHQVDAMRYGRGSAILEYGEAANYCTVVGFAGQNDNQSNRWGLVQAIPGGYLWKGRLQLGTATNPVDFRDSDRVIFIDWTPKVTINFNLIEIINDASNIEMTGFTFICLDLSTASKGRFLMTDQADVALDKCTFIDMDTFVFSYDGSNTVAVDGCIFRRCGLITIGGSTFDSCIFDAPSGTSGISTSTLDDLTGCNFISDGTGHAVNLGTISSTQSMNWNNDDTGYAATDGSTGNETILVSVDNGITLTINVGSGYTTPTIYNTGTGTVSVVSGQVTLTITVKDIDTTAVIQNARVLVTAAAGGSLTIGTVIIDKVLTDVNGEVSDTRAYSTDQPITGWVRKATGTPYYKEGPVAGTIDNATGLSLTVQLIPDA